MALTLQTFKIIVAVCLFVAGVVGGMLPRWIRDCSRWAFAILNLFASGVLFSAGVCDRAHCLRVALHISVFFFFFF